MEAYGSLWQHLAASRYPYLGQWHQALFRNPELLGKPNAVEQFLLFPFTIRVPSTSKRFGNILGHDPRKMT